MLSVNNQGLNYAQVKDLRAQYGLNEIPLADRKNFLKILVGVITQPMFALLLLAAFTYLIIGSFEDAALLAGFIVLSIGLTAYQEFKSEKAIEALKDLSSPRALVLRDGQEQRIAGKEVVMGDLLILTEGDRIAADATLIKSNDLLADESLLTGESEPVEKGIGDIVCSGCMVVRGSGAATVKAIGIKTEIGKIGKSLQSIEEPDSPLQLDIRALIRRFAFLSIGLAVLVCLIEGIIYQRWFDGLLTGISLVMALLPEEFTVILTVFMALGVWRISRQHVLTRRASVIETLGSITTLCVDKTGTLTLNSMSLQELVPLRGNQDPPFPDQFSYGQTELLNYAVLASEIEPFDPMEKAFHEKLNKCVAQGQRLVRNLQLVHEYGLSPQLSAITHIWEDPNKPGQYLVAAKGSPEAIMNLCSISAKERLVIEHQVHELGSKGLRVLGIAKATYQKQGGSWPKSVDSFHFQWLGLAGLKDPLRKEVPDAIKQCQAAGIRVIMITGDHAITAKTIASQAGIKTSTILSGSYIDRLSDKNLQDAVKNTCIFVRIRPEQKLRLVKALQANHEIVAMTGDGINDAPALKAAHVGISMGQRGTDVAREASSLVLLNDDFSSIVNTIKQGRQIFDNLQKAVIYVIAVHVPIAGAVFIPILFGVPPLLGPIHILFLEMIIDPSCAIVFETEPSEPNIMHRPPRQLDYRIFSLENLSIALLQGLGLMTIVLALYLGLPELHISKELTNTIAFSGLVIGNLLLVIVSRSKQIYFFSILRNHNIAQYWIIGITATLLSLFISVPFFRERFQFTSLSFEAIWILLASAGLALIWYETIKFLNQLRTR